MLSIEELERFKELIADINVDELDLKTLKLLIALASILPPMLGRELIIHLSPN